MSPGLISRSPDLRRLADEGYEIEIRSEHLLVHRVPYVTRARTVRYGILVAPLAVDDDRAAPPDSHTIHFIGEFPCTDAGEALEPIRHSTEREELAEGLVVDHRFSAKPHGGRYDDYHHLLTTYALILGRYARRLDPGATARSGNFVARETADGPFRYLETASSRAGITRLAESLSADRVGIVGLGGTGSHILDYVSKTRVAEIHLFDGDRFLQHNAFRAPGATTTEDLRTSPYKVTLLAERYSAMRDGIVPHPAHVAPDDLPTLAALDFVFVSVDDDDTRSWLLPALQEQRVAFIDVGMGVERAEDKLIGILRTSMSTDDARCYEPHMRRIREMNGGSNGQPNGDGNGRIDPREYERNIQIVELNALNAAHAVIRWKKYRGFYADLEGELQSTYTLDGNHLLNCG